MLSTLLMGLLEQHKRRLCSCLSFHCASRCREDRKEMIMNKGYPMVVMKLEVNESSEKRNSRQLFPTPT